MIGVFKQYELINTFLSLSLLLIMEFKFNHPSSSFCYRFNRSSESCPLSILQNAEWIADDLSLLM